MHASIGQVHHRYEVKEWKGAKGMGNSILKGISAALLVTVITLLAGLFWTAMGFEGLSTSTLVDIGLIASCIAAGYVTGKESGQWILGGVSSLGYVLLCVVLVALFLELRAWGVIQVLAEGGLIGILSGAFGGGSGGKNSRSAGWRSPNFSSWGDSYSGSRGGHSDSYNRSRVHEEWGDHEDNWDELLNDDREKSYEEQAGKRRKGWRESLWKDKQSSDEDNLWEEDEQWNGGADWDGGEKNKSTGNYRKAWWEEDVL